MSSAINTIEIFQSQPELKTVAAGENLYHEGDAADFMYGIVEGEIDLVHQGRVIETLGAGAVFGIGGILDVGPRRTDAIAQKDCKLAYLHQNHFLFAVQETPMFAIEVMKQYSQRLRQLASRQ